MKKYVATVACAAGLFALAPGMAAARDLTIVAWGGVGQDAQRAAYFEPYAKATGKKVLEDQTPLLAKVRSMVESGNVTWDLLDQESAEAVIGCEEGLFEKLDWSQIDRRNMSTTSIASAATASTPLATFSLMTAIVSLAILLPAGQIFSTPQSSPASADCGIRRRVRLRLP
jgi:spermidine/putrescine-binding protein